MNQTNKDIPAQLEAFAVSAKKAGLTSGDRVLLGAAEYVRELEAVVEKQDAEMSVVKREFCALADMAYEKYGVGWWTAQSGSFKAALAAKEARDATTH